MIMIKKRTMVLFTIFLLISVFILMVVDSRNVSAQCSGTDLFTLRLKDPNNVEIKTSPQQTINPTGGTDCNNIDTDNATINGTYCQMTGTYKANVTCDSCSVHSAVTDTIVLTCYAPETNKFLVKNSTGGNIAAFDGKGYVYLKGFNHSNQASLSPTPNSYVIKNNTGRVVAYINSSGSLFLSGSVSMKQATVSASLNSFVIRNITRKDVAYIDSSGNLVLSGVIYHNWTDTI